MCCNVPDGAEATTKQSALVVMCVWFVVLSCSCCLLHTKARLHLYHLRYLHIPWYWSIRREATNSHDVVDVHEVTQAGYKKNNVHCADTFQFASWKTKMYRNKNLRW